MLHTLLRTVACTRNSGAHESLLCNNNKPRALQWSAGESRKFKPDAMLALRASCASLSSLLPRQGGVVVRLQPRLADLLHRRNTPFFIIPSQRGFKTAESEKKEEEETPPPPAAKDKVLTVPNALCVTRMALAPYIAHLIVVQGDFPWALAFFGYAGLTDLLDGYVARRWPSQASMLGSFLDPLADKVLVAALFLSLTYVGVIPAALTSLVVSRDALLVYAGFYIRYMSVTPPVRTTSIEVQYYNSKLELLLQFSVKKYFDMRLPTAQVQPTQISKVNTLVQLMLVGGALAAPIYDYAEHPLFHGLCLLTAATTFASAVSYAFVKDTYRFSHRSYDHQSAKKLSAFVFFCLFNAAFFYLMPVRSSGSGGSEDNVIEGTEG